MGVLQFQRCKMLRDYINLTHQLNITNEKHLNHKFMYDCTNEALEYIDFCLLKYGHINYVY